MEHSNKIKTNIVKSSIAIALSFGIAGAAMAETTDQKMDFRGKIVDTCSLVVNSTGSLGVAPDAVTLSSQEVGGEKASATISTNSANSTIQVLTPLAFDSAPEKADQDTEFAVQFALDGATNMSGLKGDSEVRLATGKTEIGVDAFAKKQAGIFYAGDYILTTTIRCIAP